jgi:hypothetical protein
MFQGFPESKNLDSNSNLKVTGSLAIEPTVRKTGTSESPLITSKSKLILSSMMDINREKDNKNMGKVSVGKIIHDSSGGNTLFLDNLGVKSSSNNEDYGAQNKPNSQIEIDGKKAHILKNHKDRQDECITITNY